MTTPLAAQNLTSTLPLMRRIKAPVQVPLDPVLITDKDIPAVRLLEDVEKSPEGGSAIPREVVAVVEQLEYPLIVVYVVRVGNPAMASAESRAGYVRHPVEDRGLHMNVAGVCKGRLKPSDGGADGDRCVLVAPRFHTIELKQRTRIVGCRDCSLPSC